MAEETVVKSDLGFVQEVMDAGGEDLKKCFQCATCSVVCPISPEEGPFPRKEMLFAQWGLKDKLIANPDIWLCHQCSDCTVYCPRGAKPGEVLGVLRQKCIEHYAFPGVLAKWVGDIKFLPLLLAIPVVLFYLALKVTGHWHLPPGPVVYSKLFPLLLVDVLFTGAAAFAVYVLFRGVKNYWADINTGPYKVDPGASLWKNLADTLVDILSHDRFRQCGTTYKRSTNHLLVLVGFILLAIVTAWAVYYHYLRGLDSPYPITDPLKAVAIVGTIALIAGIFGVMKERQLNAAKVGRGTYFDWLFIYVVAAVALTGLGAWVFRLIGIRILAYPTYFLHLTSIFFLFFYAPYSKMAHMVYRTVAMLHARMSGRGF